MDDEGALAREGLPLRDLLSDTEGTLAREGLLLRDLLSDSVGCRAFPSAAQGSLSVSLEEGFLFTVPVNVFFLFYWQGRHKLCGCQASHLQKSVLVLSATLRVRPSLCTLHLQHSQDVSKVPPRS